MNKGLRGLWQRITGTHAKIQRQNVQGALAAHECYQAERRQMIEQLQERRALQWGLRQLRLGHARTVQGLRQDGKQITARFSAEEAVPKHAGPGGSNPNRNPKRSR